MRIYGLLVGLHSLLKSAIEGTHLNCKGKLCGFTPHTHIFSTLPLTENSNRSPTATVCERKGSKTSLKKVKEWKCYFSPDGPMSLFLTIRGSMVPAPLPEQQEPQGTPTAEERCQS